MFHILPHNQFIIEAMSVSFITKSIMSDFRKKHPNVIYRRVSDNPLNGENMANRRENKFINYFRDNRKSVFWKGIIKDNNMKFAVHAKPVIMESECLPCHGKPADAPDMLKKIYGTTSGFNKKVGDIIGIEYLALPLDKTFTQIKDLSFSIFIAGIIGMMLMFIAINSLINIVAVRPIGKIRSFFKSVVDGNKGFDSKIAIRSKDEIGELANSFNTMMEYLKKSKNELISSEKKYRQIFEGSKDAIIVADCLGYVQEANKAGRELLGWKETDIADNSRYLFDVFLNSSDYDKFMSDMENNGYIKDFEVRLLSAEGNVADVLMSANYREDESRQICGFETMIKDITERKRLIRQVYEAERLAAMGQLAAGVAHEINNPLSIILGYTSLLLENDSINGLVRKDLQTIYGNANSCKKIIEDLLSFSRVTETRLGYDNINCLIDSVLDMLTYEFEKKKISIVRNYCPDIPPLLIDSDKIRQVILNLLINACQAIDENGTISVLTSYDTVNNMEVIKISDDGCGIGEEIREKIFEPFFTTKPVGEGTGLGLSVSYGLIKEHGGDIISEDTGDKGAAFTIRLPLNAQNINNKD
ncbi:MAG TPA: DUF3365 domain-containing protein [Nitrospirae bacterium]|nr:DUF3365 domain-containing protein [Nitrospirota bacterium]HDZ87971.1 DUF3365 domain-containing protein [Nitrospirota bacterium]